MWNQCASYTQFTQKLWVKIQKLIELIYIIKYISSKTCKCDDLWKSVRTRGVCVTFTGVCVRTQVVALSAVTLVRAVDINTLVSAWTAQTLIHICIMTHTHTHDQEALTEFPTEIQDIKSSSIHHPC